MKDWSGGKLKIAWSQDLGEGYGSGAVAAGRYFQFDFDKASKKARLRCFNAEKGTSLWEFKYDSNYVDLYGYDKGPRSSPIVDGDRVYIFGVEGMLHCLNVESGDEVWKLDTAERFGVIQNFFGVASSPCVVDDLLIVMVGGSPEESKAVPKGKLNLVKPNGSAIVALDKLTGKVKYKMGNDLASYSSLVSTRLKVGDVEQDVVYAFARSGLLGFTAKDGTEFLNFPYRARRLETVNASSPVIDGNRVLISECYELGGTLLDLSKIDPETKTPEIVWEDGKRLSLIHI